LTKHTALETHYIAFSAFNHNNRLWLFTIQIMIGPTYVLESQKC